MIEEQESSDNQKKQWSFTNIIDHRGPTTQSLHDYKGSAFGNTDLKMYEPLDMMIKDDPITLAKYTNENDLLQTPSWKQLKCFINPIPNIKLMINKSKFKSMTPTYQFGIQVPHNA